MNDKFDNLDFENNINLLFTIFKNKQQNKYNKKK